MGLSWSGLGRHALGGRALQSPFYSRHMGCLRISRATGSRTTVTDDLVAVRVSPSYGLGMGVGSRSWDLLLPSSYRWLPVPPARPSGSLYGDWSFYGLRASSVYGWSSFFKRPLLIARPAGR